MSDQINPCPFCGHETIKLRSYGEEPVWYYAHCDECGADGPNDLGHSGAIEKWNTRADDSKLRRLMQSKYNE